MKEKEAKKVYCTPVIEVLAARIEKGYQTSPAEPEPDPQPIVEDGLTVDGANWGTGNTNSWFT